MPPDSSRNFAMVFLAYLGAFAKPVRRIGVRFCRRLIRGYGKSATFFTVSPLGETKAGESKGAIE
jgi:hypothetical protein